jgi:hypothetical protein
MNPDEFEQRLRRQPLRPAPAQWRDEILVAAQTSGSPRPTPRPRARFLPTLTSRLAGLLWPSPKAWAGLATIWAVMLAMQFSTREAGPQLAARPAPASPQILAVLNSQKQLLADLLTERSGPREADRPKAGGGRPRSELHPQMKGV